MIEVKEIIRHLSDSQAKQVRTTLAKDETYQELTLLIYDAYRSDKSSEEALAVSNLDDRSFKIFERVIYRCLLGFFQIEDTSVKDLLETSIFYALYGSAQKSKSERSDELEQLFHQMKKSKVEQQSAPLLEELYKLNKNTPLEAVYFHLMRKYQKIEAANREIISLFEALNEGLAYYKEDNVNIRQLIGFYKSIRNKTELFDNPTAQTIFQLSKASLVIIAGQNQLLKSNKQTTNELLLVCKQKVSELPFGFLRYYLKNIYNQLQILHSHQNNNIEEAKSHFESCKSLDLFKAYNFNFPKQVLDEIKPVLKEDNLKITTDEINKSHLSIGQVRLNQAIESAFNKNYFGRDRLSLFLN